MLQASLKPSYLLIHCWRRTLEVDLNLFSASLFIIAAEFVEDNSQAIDICDGLDDDEPDMELIKFIVLLTLS